jgi:ADP-ribose pyrophosphatase
LNRPYQTLSSRYLWQSRWYNLRQDQLCATDGSEVTYTVIEKPAAVWIVPVTQDGQVILINQYRYPVDAWCLEIPAGTIEPGIDPVEMAARELREEIGGTAENFIPLGDYYLMNGIGNGQARLFLALGVTLGESQREPTEYIQLRPVPFDDAVQMARTGQIQAGISALAILLAREQV